MYCIFYSTSESLQAFTELLPTQTTGLLFCPALCLVTRTRSEGGSEVREIKGWETTRPSTFTNGETEALRGRQRAQVAPNTQEARDWNRAASAQ